jgi:hypothetical protein
MTNSEKAQSTIFIDHCREANCKATPRQASKYTRGLGIAFLVQFKKQEPLKKGHPGYFSLQEDQQ